MSCCKKRARSAAAHAAGRLQSREIRGGTSQPRPPVPGPRGTAQELQHSARRCRPAYRAMPAATAPASPLPPSPSGRARRRATRRAGCRRAPRPRRRGRLRRTRPPPPPRRTCPVPDDRVGPTPRSQIRIRMRPGASTSANSTFVPSGKNGWRSSSGPRRRMRSSLSDGLQTHALRVADAQARPRAAVRRRRPGRPPRGRSGAPSHARNSGRPSSRPSSRRRFSPASVCDHDGAVGRRQVMRRRAAPPPGRARRCPRPPSSCRRRSAAASPRRAPCAGRR